MEMKNQSKYLLQTINYKSPRMQRKIFNPSSWFKKDNLKKDNLASPDESIDKVQTANQIPSTKFEPHINNKVETKESLNSTISGTKEQNAKNSELQAKKVTQAAAYVKATAGAVLREVAPDWLKSEVRSDKGELPGDKLLKISAICLEFFCRTQRYYYFIISYHIIFYHMTHKISGLLINFRIALLPCYQGFSLSALH